VGSAVEKSWPAWKDQVVLLHLLGGKTQKEIAEALTESGRKITRQAVSAILRDPRAEELMRSTRARFQDAMIESIHDELDVASKLALKVVKRTLKANISPTHKAKANQDRVALKVLSGRGFLREETKGESAGLQVPADQWDKISKALEQSDRAKEIEVVTIQDAEIIEETKDE
jgi:hypothetical protein